MSPIFDVYPDDFGRKRFSCQSIYEKFVVAFLGTHETDETLLLTRFDSLVPLVWYHGETDVAARE